MSRYDGIFVHWKTKMYITHSRRCRRSDHVFKLYQLWNQGMEECTHSRGRRRSDHVCKRAPLSGR